MYLNKKYEIELYRKRRLQMEPGTLYYCNLLNLVICKIEQFKYQNKIQCLCRLGNQVKMNKLRRLSYIVTFCISSEALFIFNVLVEWQIKRLFLKPCPIRLLKGYSLSHDQVVLDIGRDVD